MTNIPEKGEGNHAAANDYNDRTKAFAADKARVARAAREAGDALDSDQRAALEEAEAKGKARAREEDPAVS